MTRGSPKRSSAPRHLSGSPGIEILEITRFDGGSFEHHTYALAAALTRTNSAFSNHTLIYRDDKDDFLLERGHYDFPTRTAAEKDAHVRNLV
ncbi:hypothetical protein [Nocardia altamirensis]|uniref:hypothetical protein n=1 Tax=Nocardia altamirensis TaxID=472158 RepID=UPI000840028E|nr:hypothetical protein [Nocardia altamirensis]